MSIFESAWTDVNTTAQSVMGQAITINGQEITAEVSTITTTTRLRTGARVMANTTNIILTPQDMSRTSASKGAIVTAGALRFRVMSIADLGGAGFELTCEAEDQRKAIPGVG